MPGPAPCAAHQSTPGLLAQARLKPWALLRRLRPVKLESLAVELGHQARLAQALRLLERHFPAALAEHPDVSGTGWWEVMAHACNLAAEADLFEVNWPLLNDAWAYWMEEPSENGDHLATFLVHLPLVLYGFDHADDLFDCPSVELLHCLLSDCQVGAVSTHLLVAGELYDNLDEWTGADRQAAWERIFSIEADPGCFPPGLCHLPCLARWATHRTGNPILDNAFDPYEDGPWFTWATDLPEISAAWRQAQPYIAQLKRLAAWCDEADNIAHLATFLMTEDMDYERIAWW